MIMDFYRTSKRKEERKKDRKCNVVMIIHSEATISFHNDNKRNETLIKRQHG